MDGQPIWARERWRTSQTSYKFFISMEPAASGRCLAVPITHALSAIGRLAQMHGGGPLRLHCTTDLLVRRTQSNQVLRVKSAEGCHDSGSDSDDALFHAWPKHSDPKVAAKKQLGTAHGGRAAGMGRAIMLHLFDRRYCIIHAAAPTGG
jgi:hypothetical protein